MWSFVETAIILPPKLKPNTPLIEKPIMQPIKVTGKTASFAVEIPVITSSGSGRNQLQLKPCRGGGNHYVIQLAKVKGSEIKWAVFRNFKQTDEGELKESEVGLLLKMYLNLLLRIRDWHTETGHDVLAASSVHFQIQCKTALWRMERSN